MNREEREELRKKIDAARRKRLSRSRLGAKPDKPNPQEARPVQAHADWHAGHSRTVARSGLDYRDGGEIAEPLELGARLLAA